MQRFQNYTKDSEKSSIKIEDIKEPKGKSWIVFLSIGIFGILAGAGCIAAVFLMPEKILDDITFPTIPSKVADESSKTYSNLTGQELADASLNNSPAYCIQIPNGLDGARPQTGLQEAGVVFEAIAERGVTRFAAIFQNPTNSIIGPIRSLRLYYLQWDTPFDCTIVHAGGSDEAMAAVQSGGYKTLMEDYDYEYRGNYDYHLWNNLFTTPGLLAQNSADFNRGASNIKGFTRVTPETAAINRVNSTATEKLEITTATDNDTSALTPEASSINISFSNNSYFDVVYSYNAETNSYDRSYAYGEAHTSYKCPEENLINKDPQDVCSETQLSPSVVIAMFVNESVASDNYHENITTIGNGTAYVFQNGTVTKGTWNKNSTSEQIRFYDESDNEISLIPGQTWVSAIPQYGSIDF